jgi:hypothetical protein
MVVSGLHRDSTHGHQVLKNQRLGPFLLAQNFGRTTKNLSFTQKILPDFFSQKSEKAQDFFFPNLNSSCTNMLGTQK